MIYLTAVDPHSEAHAVILYSLLEERTVQQSISHKAMPTYKQHRDFIKSNPYIAWYLIGHEGNIVGATYISKAKELGIFIFNEFHGFGYGREAIKEIMNRFEGPFLANINPANEASRRFFIDLGFERIQETFKHD